MDSLALKVLTPERVLLQVERAIKIRLRLADQAWISIFPNHAPLVAETLDGPLAYDTEIESGSLNIAAGFLYVEDNRVHVLTRGALDQASSARGMDIGEGARFDRLARELMVHLNAQPAPAADVAREGDRGPHDPDAIEQQVSLE